MLRFIAALLLMLLVSSCHKSSVGLMGNEGMGIMMTQTAEQLAAAQEERIPILIDSFIHFEHPNDLYSTQPSVALEKEMDLANATSAVVHMEHSRFIPGVDKKAKGLFAICAPADGVALAMASAGYRRDKYNCFKAVWSSNQGLLSPKNSATFKYANTHAMPVYLGLADEEKFIEAQQSSYLNEVAKLATTYPKVTFIVTRLGSPWFKKTAEIFLKYKNIYVETSAINNEDAAKENLSETQNRVNKAIAPFLAAPSRILFGSGWPKNIILNQVQWVQKAVPKQHWRAVFFENALSIFKFPIESSEYQKKAKALNPVPTEAPEKHIPATMPTPSSEPQ